MIKKMKVSRSEFPMNSTGAEGSEEKTLCFPGGDGSGAMTLSSRPDFFLRTPQNGLTWYNDRL